MDNFESHCITLKVLLGSFSGIIHIPIWHYSMMTLRSESVPSSLTSSFLTNDQSKAYSLILWFDKL